VTIRSQCVLEIDLVDAFWKALQHAPYGANELEAFDFTAHSNLQFRDPRDAHFFSESEFEDIYSELKFTTVLSDGTSHVDLLPTGAASNRHVTFDERWQYARLATRARLDEASLGVHAIRRGLYSIVPRAALRLLTCRSWRNACVERRESI